VEKVISDLVEEMDLARALIQTRASEITGLGLRIKTGPIRVNSCTDANSNFVRQGREDAGGGNDFHGKGVRHLPYS
jgi:hypothetical protein